MDGLNLVITITDREKTETAIKLFQECNVFTTDIVLGQGTAPREILEYLYLSPAEKSIIFGVVTHAGLSALLRHLKRKMYIDIPGNGIAVTVPLNSIGGKRSLEVHADRTDVGNEQEPGSGRKDRKNVHQDRLRTDFCSCE